MNYEDETVVCVLGTYDGLGLRVLGMNRVRDSGERKRMTECIEGMMGYGNKEGGRIAITNT